MSSSSITPRCAFSATAEVSWVRTTMPSVQSMVHEAIGLRWPSTSTRHWRQAPILSSSGWSQNRGIWMPSISAALITRVFLGTLISKPSMVTVTVPGVVSTVISVAPEEGRGGRVERAAAFLLVLHELVPEVLDARGDRAGRAVTQGAERPAEDVVADVQELVQVFLGAAAAFQPFEHPDHPERALPARRALAARLVLVELGPAQHGADHAGGLVEDLQRPGAEHGPGRRDRLEVQRHVQVLVGQDRGG